MKSFSEWMESNLPEVNCECDCKPCMESDCKNCSCKNCKCKGCKCKELGEDSEGLFRRVKTVSLKSTEE